MAEKIIFDFELNTSGGQRSVNELKDRIKQLTKALNDADVGSKSFNDLNRELAKTRVEADNLNRVFKDTRLTVDIDTLKSDNSLAGLQNRMKLLKSEIRGLDIGSEEFKKLEREIAKTSIEMKGLKESFRGLDFGAVLGEAGAVLSGAAGAVGILNDVMMDANEESAKYIENATRTIMVMQGVQSVMAGVDSAVKLVNITMEKNPILIWVAAAAALVGGLIALTKWLKSTNNEMIEMNNLSETQKSLLKGLRTEYIRFQLELAETNKNIKEQIDLKNQLIDMELDQKIKDIAKEFDIEADAIKNASNNYKDYNNNLALIQSSRKILLENQKSYVNASKEERQELDKSNKEAFSQILTLNKQNKAYEDLYGGVTRFTQLYRTVSEQEKQNNQAKLKTYTDLFKTIKDDGTEAYKAISAEIKKMQDDLNNLNNQVFNRGSELRERDIDLRIEEAKRIMDIDKLVALNKEKLSIEIDRKEKERVNLIEEYNQKRKDGNEIIEEHKKKILENNKAIEDFNKQYEEMAGKTVPTSDYEEMLKQRKTVTDLRDELKQQYNKLISEKSENEKQLQKSFNDLNKIVKKEKKELEDLSKRSNQEFIKEALKSTNQYSDKLKNEVYTKRIEDYNDFLTDETELLNISEEDKKNKIIGYLQDRYTLERSELQSKIKGDLSLFESYFKKLDQKYVDNFDKNIDLLVVDDSLRNKSLENVQEMIYKEIDKSKLLLDSNKLTQENRKIEESKIDLYNNQLFILSSIGVESSKILKTEEKMSQLNTDQVESLRDYKRELDKINKAREDAEQKEIEATLKSLMLNQQKYSALMQLENLKLERYKGYLNKENAALKDQLQLRKKMELDTAKELYTRKLLSHEEYLETIENIEAVHKRREEEGNLERLKKVLDVGVVLYEGYFQVIANLQQALLDKRLAAIDREKNAAIDSLDEQLKNQLITQEQYDEQKKNLDENTENEKKKLQYEQAKRNKQNAIIEAGLALAVGVIKAIPNPALIALSMATGAVNMATIASSPLPQYERGGLIGGKSHKNGGTIIEAEKDEIILNKRVRSNPTLNNIASMINESTGGRSFRVPMPQSTNSTNDMENLVKSIVMQVKSIPVINVATDTEKVNNSVKRLQNKAKL
jgi:hypothetical protein